VPTLTLESWPPETIVSVIAAVLTTAAFVPQALHIIRRRETAAVSLVMYSMFATGVFFWGIFGVMIDNWAIVLANVITFVLAMMIVVLKLRYG
jgi:MtN3 and saliva related transmembrane protein